jgi:hypothetical protein
MLGCGWLNHGQSHAPVPHRHGIGLHPLGMDEGGMKFILGWLDFL